MEEQDDRPVVTDDYFDAVIRSTTVKHFRIQPLQGDTKYRISVSAMTQGCEEQGLGEPTSIDSKTLPENINMERT